MLTQQEIWTEILYTCKETTSSFPKMKRLEFAKKHIDWSVEDWKKVLLSDESTFQQFTVEKNHVC